MAETHTHDEPLSTEKYRAARPHICGPEDGPEAPFPIVMYGLVQSGFGRGSKELGCPTANLPEEAILPMTSQCKAGIYYGYARVHQPPHGEPVDLGETGIEVHPMVMSLGWNPFYKNEKMTAVRPSRSSCLLPSCLASLLPCYLVARKEVHIIHQFEHDFYGHEISVIVLGYIRPELDYTSRDALIEDIAMDIRVTLNSLGRPGYTKYREDVSWAQAKIK